MHKKALIADSTRNSNQPRNSAILPRLGIFLRIGGNRLSGEIAA
jgi:hypothetical protein